MAREIRSRLALSGGSKKPPAPKFVGERAFVIGNGPSRQHIDLESLRPYGKIWGCNALYRDFLPDHLVAVDRTMQTEIIAAKPPCQLHFREHNRDKAANAKLKLDHINFFTKRNSNPNNSGVEAIYFAMRSRASSIYLLGFDFSTENVYRGTDNYKTAPRKVRKNVQETIEEFAKKYTIYRVTNNPQLPMDITYDDFRISVPYKDKNTTGLSQADT